MGASLSVRRFLRNSAWAYAADWAGATIGLPAIPIWSRVVTPDDYARWLLVASAIEIVGKPVMPHPETLAALFTEYRCVYSAKLRNHELEWDGPILRLFLSAELGGCGSPAARARPPGWWYTSWDTPGSGVTTRDRES